MPLDMVVAPLTLEQTVDVVCAPFDVDDADDDEPDPEFEREPPMAMPAIEPAVPLEPEPEPEPEPESEPVPAREPAVFPAAEPVDVGCDDASETVVAESTRTAATPIVASPAHHNLAASPSADQRSRIDNLSCSIAILLVIPWLPVSARDVSARQRRCEGTVIVRSPSPSVGRGPGTRRRPPGNMQVWGHRVRTRGATPSTSRLRCRIPGASLSSSNVMPRRCTASSPGALQPGTVDDLLSETFVTAFRTRQNYDLTYGDARPWFFGIAVNVVRHHHRSEARRTAMVGRVMQRATPEHTMPDAADDALAHVESENRVEGMAAALRAIDPRYLDVLLLVSGPQLSYEEIARRARDPRRHRPLPAVPWEGATAGTATGVRAIPQ